jgi:hypothetical protein
MGGGWFAKKNRKLPGSATGTAEQGAGGKEQDLNSRSEVNHERHQPHESRLGGIH